MTGPFSRVAVVYGGESSEREVSLRTGAAIAAALRRGGVEVVEFDLKRAQLQQMLDSKPDAVFIALHGKFGEDGTLQGVLEWHGIPYTGPGVCASSLAMDKLRTKWIMLANGIPTPGYVVVARGTEVCPREFPVVVKPTLDGSSVGVSLVRNPSQWTEAMARCATGRGQLLVEDLIDGREMTVAILDGEVLGIVEIAAADGFYDYDAKYQRGDTQYLCPAPVSPEVRAQIETYALATYRAAGCRGVSRVDLMLDASDRPFFLEVNTIPGMTATSLVPKAAAAVGISFDELCLRMLAGATLDEIVVGETK